MLVAGLSLCALIACAAGQRSLLGGAITPHSFAFLLPSLAGYALAATSTVHVPFAPTAGATWNIELINVPNVSQADAPQYHIWDYDVLDAPKSTIQAFQAKGHPVICYFSAGTWESWRADADDFPQAAIGKTVDGWPKEKWLNTSNPKVRDIMVQRIDIAQSKGCNGIDPDNVDGYDNDTGFDLTKADAVDYLQFLASTASFRGMACGLKNAGAIIDQVINITAFAVNEQCVEYHECDPFQAYIKANKPVFHLEYTAKQPAPAKFVHKACDAPGAKGFSTLIKHLSLNAWTKTCPAGSNSTTNATSTGSSPTHHHSGTSTPVSNDASGALGPHASEVWRILPHLFIVVMGMMLV